MKHGKLIQITSNHKRVRTSEMEGHFETPPTVGQGFAIIGKPINPEASMRVIHTSEVKEVKNIGNRIVFTTQNSEYELVTTEKTSKNYRPWVRVYRAVRSYLSHRME